MGPVPPDVENVGATCRFLAGCRKKPPASVFW